jgi:hypothetical protein
MQPVPRVLVLLAAIALGAQFATGAPAAKPRVVLTGPAQAVGNVKYRVTTTAPLGRPGATVRMELRGIDLNKNPRSTYERADVVRTDCKTSPCTFQVGQGPGAHLQFEAFLIDGTSFATIATSKPLVTTWAPSPWEYARCTSSTACRATQAVPIISAQEMSWRVTVPDNAGAAVDAFQVCLVGKG